MKILMVTCADSIHAVRWANAFAAKGNEVHFVAEKGHEVKGDKMDPNVKIYYLKYSGSKGYILNARQLHKLWRQIQPDVVNTHYASGYGLLSRLANIHPQVLSVWGSDVYDFPKVNRLNKAIVVGNLKKADAIASTSHVMAEQVRRLMNNPNQPITITPFGVNIDKFTPEGEAVKDDNIFLFGTIKKLTYKYGIDYILKAFALFMEKWKAEGSLGRVPHLFICGKGENRKDFENLRDELGLAPYVEIQGYIPNDEVPKLLRSFDLFCLGSVEDSESFGVAAVEAMACGLPVLATDVDGFKEVIENNITGFIVPRMNAEAMADKMWQLYTDPTLRLEFGKNARKRVCDMYNWENNIETLLNVLVETSSRKD